MISTQIITRVYKDSLTLTYPPKHQNLTDITVLKPTGNRFFDTIIDVDY